MTVKFAMIKLNALFCKVINYQNFVFHISVVGVFYKIALLNPFWSFFVSKTLCLIDKLEQLPPNYPQITPNYWYNSVHSKMMSITLVSVRSIMSLVIVKSSEVQQRNQYEFICVL